VILLNYENDVCAGVGTWASAVWARMAKKKDGTANMQKGKPCELGDARGTPGKIWLKSEILG
jgi:hypothetical protein